MYEVFNVRNVFVPKSLIPIDETIVFFEADLLHITQSHEDSLILTLNVVEYNVYSLLVNQGSFVSFFAYIRLQVDEHLNECARKSQEGVDGLQHLNHHFLRRHHAFCVCRTC